MNINELESKAIASLTDEERELKDALVALWGLSEDAIASILQSMRSARKPFGEAAVANGCITQRELDDTLSWMEWVRQTSRRTSVVEAAIRRSSRARAVSLRHASTVRASPKLTLAHDPHHPHSERIRALRTELLLLDSAGKPCTLAVLSPSASEGRSLLASELAIAFSQLGTRTLLVDADLRQSRQHTLYGDDNSSGLAQAIAFPDNPARLLGVEGLPHLSFLPAGPAADSPLELLSGGRFERLLSEWRRDFGFIILDTPPVSQYSDALVIASLARQVVLVSRAKTTSQKSMKDMVRRLGSTRARVLGAVLNHF